MTALRVVESGSAAGDGPPVYPLPAEVSLAAFGHVNERPGWLLGCEMVALGGAGPALASWVLLRAHAFATQTPGGTLPVADAHLAGLAGCDGAAWAERRALALHGWRRVAVRTADGADAGLRLAHPEVQVEAERLYAALLDRRDEASAHLIHQHRCRIRGQIVKLGADRRLLKAEPVERVRIWLRARALGNTLGHVESALLDVGPEFLGDTPAAGARCQATLSSLSSDSSPDSSAPASDSARKLSGLRPDPTH